MLPFYVSNSHYVYGDLRYPDIKLYGSKSVQPSEPRVTWLWSIEVALLINLKKKH